LIYFLQLVGTEAYELTVESNQQMKSFRRKQLEITRGKETESISTPSGFNAAFTSPTNVIAVARW